MAKIISASPYNNEKEVYIGRPISVQFDSDMDPAYINSETFVVYDQLSDILQGVYSYDGAVKTATFKPANPLLIRSQYQVVVEGGDQGVRTVVDWTGNYDTLDSNYAISFITNDGRFATPIQEEATPSGVPSNIVYPSGVTYFTDFAVIRTNPSNQATLLDPSGVNIDASGIGSISIYFNKPVDPTTLSNVTIVGADALQDPFIESVDLTQQGTWTVNKWIATFRFNDPGTLHSNEEIDVTIPTTVTATDGTSLINSGAFSFYFATKYSPMYIGANAVRVKLGAIAADIPDDTINRLIWMNSIRAMWFSSERPPLIKPFWSPMFDPSLLLTFRPTFQVDKTGAPKYVKEYVLAQTMLDILKARFYGFIDGIMLGGGPGASKSLADLRIASSNGTMYASTIGPLIDQLEGPMSEYGSIAYWLGYITGRQRWVPSFALGWGPDITPHRAAMFAGTGTATGGGNNQVGGTTQKSI
jgi:hypothetical protein